MHPMDTDQNGMELDPNVLIATQSNFIAQARVKEVQMEAAITQLRQENYELRQSLASRDEIVTEEGNEGLAEEEAG